MISAIFASTVFSAASYAIDSSNVYSSSEARQLRAHVLSLTKRSGNNKLFLDLSDEKQYQFILHRLHASNNTPENSPQLYRMLKNLRTKHTKKLPHLKSMPALLSDNPSVTEANSHMIFSAYISEESNDQTINTLTSASNQAKSEKTQYLVADARSSVEGGSDYSLVDLLVFDAKGQQIGVMGVNEAFAGGKDELATVYQDIELLRQTRPELFPSSYDVGAVIDDNQDKPAHLLMADSMSVVGKTVIINGEPKLVEEVTFKVVDFYMPEPVGLPGADNAIQPKYQYDHVHPTDLDGDGTAMLCLNRAHADCDYAIDQADHSNDKTFVRIPWEGTMWLPHKIDEDNGVLAPGQEPADWDAQTEIWVSSNDVGGATRLQSPAGKKFHDYIDVNVDLNTKITELKWKIPRDEGVFANVTLFDRYERVHWWFNVVVNTTSFYSRGEPALASDNDRNRPATALFTVKTLVTLGHPPSYNFSDGIFPLKFAYSCLAKGSLITMADGTKKTIETIKVGELVVANGVNMLVDDVSVGIETIPMTRLVDEKGREVLLTESHPVMKPGNRAVWASEIKKGDLVLTASGPSRIVKVKQEMFDEGVFNLKLAPVDGNTSTLAAHANAFLANGFLVGDLKMQADNEFKHMKTKEEDILSRLPKAWHEDYMMRQTTK